MEFDINFTDITLNEAEGNYERVVEIMLSEDGVDPNDWMIATDMTIASDMGMGFLELHFYNNKKVYIGKFKPSDSELYCPDLTVLSEWLAANGWSKAEPLPIIVGDNIELWRHWWEVNIIDSEVMDEMYGKREEMIFGNPDDYEDEE